MNSNVLTMIMAGGKGERLYPLTRDRAKPAVPFGGIYRIIDFTLSNCVNSNLRKICLLTQYKSVSLMRHLQLGWNVFNLELGEFIEIIPAQQRIGEVWYRGTADSIYQNLYKIEDEAPEDVVILGGDHIYKMNYSKMLDFHSTKSADLTIGIFRFEKKKAGEFGILKIDKDERVREFLEKPARLDCFDDKFVYISMGIYIFRSDVLKKVLRLDAQDETSRHDFARDIIPRMLRKYRVYGYSFNRYEKDSYWRDIGTIDAYFEANMELVKSSPKINLYDPIWPIRTYQEQFPPAKITGAKGKGSIRNSIISHGCIIKGKSVERSLLSYGVKVLENSKISSSILMENVTVGKNSVIKNAIIDKDVVIPSGTNIGMDLQRDRQKFMVTHSGIVVVPKRQRVKR